MFQLSKLHYFYLKLKLLKIAFSKLHCLLVLGLLCSPQLLKGQKLLP